MNPAPQEIQVCEEIRDYVEDLVSSCKTSVQDICFLPGGILIIYGAAKVDIACPSSCVVAFFLVRKTPVNG